MGEPREQGESGRNEARGQLSQATFMCPLLVFHYYTVMKSYLKRNRLMDLKNKLMVSRGKPGGKLGRLGLTCPHCCVYSR